MSPYVGLVILSMIIMINLFIPIYGFGGALSKKRVQSTAFLKATLSPDPIDTFNILEQILFSRFAESVSKELDSTENTKPATKYGELIAQINRMARDPDVRVIHAKGKAMLVRLFPKWLLIQYKWMFSRPFPLFSAWMNAWVTKFATQWLMGPSEVVDIDMPDGTVGKQLGLKIEKCHFLEESGCIKTCLHACKVPTQNFFSEEMGLNVTLQPDLETLGCDFLFGVAPLALENDPIVAAPCFTTCSMVGKGTNQNKIRRKNAGDPPCSG